MVIFIFISIGIFVFIDYQRFLYQRKKEINSFSIINTSFGEVSYVDINSEFLSASMNMSKAEIKKHAKLLMQCKQTKQDFLAFVKSMTPMSAIYGGMMKEVEMTQNLDIDLTKITIPCLAVHSILDKDVSIEHLNYLENNIDNVTVIRCECMGHYVWWGNKSEEVKVQSMEFLSE